MSLNQNIACRIEPKSVGWWLHFDADATAGLLLTSIEEKLAFARDCGIDLMPHELSASWFFTKISECPRAWYSKATLFKLREPF